ATTASEAADNAEIEPFQTVVTRIEPTKENVPSPVWIRSAQPEGALCRLQGDGVDSADQGSRGDDQGKLPVHLAGYPGHECRRNKNRHQHQSNTDDRAE